MVLVNLDNSRPVWRQILSWVLHAAAVSVTCREVQLTLWPLRGSRRPLDLLDDLRAVFLNLQRVLGDYVLSLLLVGHSAGKNPATSKNGL